MYFIDSQVDITSPPVFSVHEISMYANVKRYGGNV